MASRFSIEQLKGLKFKGHFQRDAALQQASRERTERIKDRHPKAYASRTKSDESANRRYDFSVKFLDVDPVSGLVIARGSDELGESGLVGRITIERPVMELKMRKIYVARAPNLPEHIDPCGVITYTGVIDKPDNVITMGGEYVPGWGRDTIDNYKGDWRLDSEPVKD